MGWRAHFLHGRILQELGQTSDAKAIYEEVAACDARNIDGRGREQAGCAEARAVKKTGLEDFFADVEQYYLQTLYQLSDKDQGLHGGSQDLAGRAQGQFRKMLRLPGIDLGVCQELRGDRQPVQEPTKKTADHAGPHACWAEMAKIPSPYQEDAIKLRRQLNPNGSAEEGFEDAVIDGDAAVGEEEMGRGHRVLRKGHCGRDPQDRSSSVWPP